MEEMLKKVFRNNDLLFYNERNSTFIFSLPMMKKNNIKNVEEKVRSFGIPYILSIESINIDINSKLFEVKNELGIK